MATPQVFAPVPAGVYPANATAAYRSSDKRAPRESLIVIPHRSSEISGPRFGREMLRGVGGDVNPRHSGGEDALFERRQR